MRITPYYPLTEGLSQKDIRKAAYAALSLLMKSLRMYRRAKKENGLAEINFCISNIHFPNPWIAGACTKETGI